MEMKYDIVPRGASNNHKNTKTDVFKSQSIISGRPLYLSSQKNQKKMATHDKGKVDMHLTN